MSTALQHSSAAGGLRDIETRPLGAEHCLAWRSVACAGRLAGCADCAAQRGRETSREDPPALDQCNEHIVCPMARHASMAYVKRRSRDLVVELGQRRARSGHLLLGTRSTNVGSPAGESFTAVPSTTSSAPSSPERLRRTLPAFLSGSGNSGSDWPSMTSVPFEMESESGFAEGAATTAFVTMRSTCWDHPVP
jgi:hypothetical protein